MAELKATVCLQGKDIEVISSHIEFNRKTDNKGRPVTNVIGGRITITVESTRETTILEAMVNSPFKAISGKVIYYNTKDNFLSFVSWSSNMRISYITKRFTTLTGNAKCIPLSHFLRILL